MLKRLVRAILPLHLRYWLRWKRNLAPDQALSLKQIDLLYRRMRSGLDLSRIKTMSDQACTQDIEFLKEAIKYCDHKAYLKINIMRAARLRLHKESKMEIFDIGCGTGWFLYAARELGHSSEGMDMPPDKMKKLTRFVYSEMSDILHVRDSIRPQLVHPMTPLALDKKVDLITAFQVCFNRSEDTAWGLAEWKFFLDDIGKYLKKGGRFYMELNAFPDLYPNGLYFNGETKRFLRSVGELDDNRFTWRSDQD